MRELKGWPFEPLDDGVQPCDDVGNGRNENEKKLKGM